MREREERAAVPERERERESESKTKLKTARHIGPLTPTKTNYLKAGIKTQYLVTEGTKKEREREGEERYLFT